MPSLALNVKQRCEDRTLLESKTDLGERADMHSHVGEGPLAQRDAHHEGARALGVMKQSVEGGQRKSGQHDPRVQGKSRVAHRL